MTDRPDAHANPLPANDLAAFVAVVETASVQDAGDALSVTGSAVTKRLQSLERRLGTPLFERRRTGMRATAAGQRLYPEAKRALEALQRAEEAVTERPGGTVSIAASHTVGEYLLPGWIAAFRREVGEVRAQVDVVNSPRVLEAVAAGEVELGFVEGTDDLRRFTVLPVHADRMCVLVAAGHPWSRRGRARPEQLAREPYLTREAGSGTRAVAAQALARAGVPERPDFEAASTQAVKRALAGGGYTILSRLAVEAELRDGSLATVAVEGLELERRLYAVHDARRRPTGLAGALWTWLERQPADS